MKRILICAILISSVATCYAMRASWNEREKPSLSLAQALPLAQKALHKRAKDFYCLGASLANTHHGKGDWTFTFGSKNGEYRVVVVTLDKKVVRIAKEPLAY